MKKGLHKLQHREFTVAQNGYYTVLKPATRFFSTLLHGKREHLVMTDEDAAAMRDDQEPETLHQSQITYKSPFDWFYTILAVVVVLVFASMLVYSIFNNFDSPRNY